MTPGSDIAPVLRKVAELRRLCLRVPHLATPAEQACLARFAVIEQSPEMAGPHDADAIVAGWREHWRLGETGAITRMAVRLPPAFVESDRWLVSLNQAAAAVDSP